MLKNKHDDGSVISAHRTIHDRSIWLGGPRVCATLGRYTKTEQAPSPDKSRYPAVTVYEWMDFNEKPYKISDYDRKLQDAIRGGQIRPVKF
jgi:hypothetical protein